MEYWSKEGFVHLFHRDDSWRQWLRFCSLWAHSGSLLDRYVSDVWFEFDSHQLDKDLPAACFFFSPRNLHNRNTGDNGKTDWLFKEALAITFNEYLSDKLKVNIKKCVDALPGNGIVFQIGVLAARKVSHLRVCTSMPVDLYVGYLEKVGWKGSYNFLNHMLRSLRDHVDAIFIDLDVGEDILPAIGLECCYRGGVNIKTRVEKFLDFLREQHLCINNKQEDILSWFQYPGEHLDRPSSKHIHQKKVLSHIKIVIDADNSMRAKAYLALSKGDI